MRSAAVAILLGVALAACASYGGRGLQPGRATEADVRRVMGEPALEFSLPDGGRQLAYPRGPLGTETFMARLGPDGRLREIEQVLDEAHFARIRVGASGAEDVRRLLGPPYAVESFPRQGQTAWVYRFTDLWLYPADFSVIFGPDGRVVDKVTVRVDSPEFPR